MARAPAKAKVAAKSAVEPEIEEPKVQMSTSTAVANWEEQMLADAELAAGMEKNVGGTPFFKTEGGILQFQDQAIPGNTMAVVILDHVFENILYDGEYDPKKKEPPVCFAFGRNEEEMGPHETVVARDQAQHEQCAGCPMNSYGTADKGRGKACSNKRRLAVMPAGTINPKTDVFVPFKTEKDFNGQPVGLLGLPPTSLKAWATYVKSIFLDKRRPPYGVVTKITLERDVKTQIRFEFELLDVIPNTLMPYIYKQHEKAMSEIEAPHNLDAVDESREGSGKRPPIKGRGNLKPAKAPAARSSRKY